jgi:hypothetical protein
LAELWEEYQFGIGGKKPAKDWSSTERGNTMHGIKQKYYRRKMVWLSIQKLMERGNSRDAAINKIRQAYGWRCSVTQTINFIIANHHLVAMGTPTWLISLPIFAMAAVAEQMCDTLNKTGVIIVDKNL